MTTKKRKSPSDTTASSKLEGLVAKLASAVENATNVMTGIAERVEGLERKSQEVGKLPMVESEESQLKTAMSKVHEDGDIGESQRVVDFLNPRGQDSGFQPNDVVMLGENSEHYKGYLVDSEGEPVKADEEGKPALGVVLNYMYTRRDGQRKYKVNFPKIGKSSFMEKEMVLVKAA